MTQERDPKPVINPEKRTHAPVGPGLPPLGSTFDPAVVDFGHYAGRTIEELAEVDPPFLYWLARHPSGLRYREEIARVLGARQPQDY